MYRGKYFQQFNSFINLIKQFRHKKLSHQINSTKRSKFPKLKINNISPRIYTKRSQNNESVKKREEQLEQYALPKLLENKALLQLKILRHRHTEIQVIQEIEKIIRRNLFYIPTHKYSIVD